MAEEWVEFTGACCPPAESDDHDGYYVTGQDMIGNIMGFPGLPVLKEHDANLKVGEITKARIDERNRLLVEGRIDRRTHDGAQLVRDIREGKIRSLSVGTRNFALKEDPDTIIGKRFTEVSFVKLPDHAETDVQYIQNDSSNFVRQRKLLGQFADLKLKQDLYLASQANHVSEQRRGQHQEATTTMAQPPMPMAPPMTTGTAPPPAQMAASMPLAPAPVSAPPMSAPPMTAPPMTAQTAAVPQQQQQQQPVAPDQEMLTPEQMQQRNAELLQQLADYQYREEHRDDIELKERQEHQERIELAEKHKDYQITLDRLTAEYAKEGTPMPNSVKHMFAIMDTEHADKVSPMVSAVTVATAAHAKSQTKLEKVRKEHKEKKNELKEKIRLFRQNDRDELQRANYEQQASSYAPSNLPAPMDTSTPQMIKKPKLEETSAQETYSASNAGGGQDLSSIYITHKLQPIAHGRGMQNSADPQHVEMLSKVWGTRLPRGSAKAPMSFPRFAGKDMVGQVQPVGSETWTTVEAERQRQVQMQAQQ